MTERYCVLPGGESGAGEWCKEYCPNYGTGRCRWDAATRRMVVMLPDNQSVLEVEE